MDIDGSSHVLVRNCVVTAGDDAFCIKTSGFRGVRRAASDIVIEDCVARSPTNGFKIGTETLDDIRDVVFRRCRVEAPLPFIAPLAGVNIASVDGARVGNVRVDAMTMTRVRCPVFIRLGARWKNVPPDQRRAGTIESVRIADVHVTSSRQCVTLAGLSGQPLRDIRLKNIRVENWDGTASSHAPSDVPDSPAAYPEAPMFGKLPASLVFARHVEGLQIHDVTLQAAGDGRVTAIVKEDVRDDLTIPASP